MGANDSAQDEVTSLKMSGLGKVIMRWLCGVYGKCEIDYSDARLIVCVHHGATTQLRTCGVNDVRASASITYDVGSSIHYRLVT